MQYTFRLNDCHYFSPEVIIRVQELIIQKYSIYFLKTIAQTLYAQNHT